MAEEAEKAAEEEEAVETVEEDTEGEGKQEETATEPTEEDRARALGWVPKDEFKGHPDDWVPAEEWVNTTPKKLRQTNRQLEQRLERTERALKQMSDFQSKAEKKAYEKAVKDVRAQMRKAAEEGDAEGVEKAAEELEKIERPVEQKTDADDNTPPPEFQDWVSRNKWFVNEKGNTEYDPVLAGAARSLSEELARQHPEDIDAHLRRLDRKLREEFPNKFGNKRRSEPNPVEPGGNRAGSGKKGKGWDAIPSDIRNDAKEMIGPDMPFKTKEEYAKTYFEHYGDQ